MNLYLDVTPAGSITFNFPDVDPSDMVHSCALDLAQRESTLEDVARVLNVTRERARQIEDRALIKLAHGQAARLKGE